MASDLITLGLEGEVSLEILATEARHLHGLIKALADELAKTQPIEWTVEDASAGSFSATLRGQAADMESVVRVTQAFVTVGKALQAGVEVPYSSKVAKEARALVEVLSDKVTSIRFETPEDEATVVSRVVRLPVTLQRTAAYGAVEGRIQTLTNRGSLRFTLYDVLHDKAVTCYLREGQQEMMLDHWGQRAMVEGLVSRDPVSGRPVSIRQITAVEALDKARPGAFDRARGIVPFTAEDPKPEELIRRLRDA
jgi:hypothetical protein